MAKIPRKRSVPKIKVKPARRKALETNIDLTSSGESRLNKLTQEFPKNLGINIFGSRSDKVPTKKKKKRKRGADEVIT